ncbi:MAG: glycerol-3-phosphate dehydrogenase/oxidase [Candidatus Hodarchaeales archaeon]
MAKNKLNPIESRNDTIKRMNAEEFDVVIIGGGINGVGIARDAILRGFSVALIEKNDFGYGTSSGSSKLVHAGLRYLAQKEFRLVREASIERKKILEMAPHITRPLEFLLPLYSDMNTSKSRIRLGVWLYDLLATFRNYTFHKIRNSEIGRNFLPNPIREENFQGIASYGDGQMDDARFTLEVMLSAEEHGALVLNYCQAVNFNEDSQGNIESLIAIDNITNEKIQIKAKSFVLACGHWTDDIIQQINPSALKRIRQTKGIHLITKRFYNKDYAVVVPVQDGRIMFLVPFGKYQLVGTTDTDYSGNFDDIPVSAEDIEYVISAVNYIFPNALRKEDVISAYSGLRPLLISSDAKSEDETSRKHEIFTIKPNVLVIAGGKFTTYRSMAKELVDQISKFTDKKTKCKTDKVPLFGWLSTKRKYWKEWVIISKENMKIRYQLPDDVAEHLLRYGKNYLNICNEIDLKPELREQITDNRPNILAEINYSIKYEKALTLSDFMLRRTQIQLSEDQGLDCAEIIANHMGKILKWSYERIRNEIDLYKTSLVWNP